MMRERIKCPNCNLVQWREEACKRCGMAFDAEPEAPEEFPAASDDPYAPPAEIPAVPPSQTLYSPSDGSSFGTITPETVLDLERASPWMSFLAILGLLAALLYIGLGVIAFFVTVGAGASAEKLGMGAGAAAVYVFLGLFYWATSSRLRNAAAASKKIRQEGAEALALVAHNHYKFWRLVGMLVLVSFLLAVVIVLILVVTGFNM